MDIQFTFTPSVRKTSLPIKWIHVRTTIIPSAFLLCMHLIVCICQPSTAFSYCTLCFTLIKALHKLSQVFAKHTQCNANNQFPTQAKLSIWSLSAMHRKKLYIEHQKLSSCRMTGKNSQVKTMPFIKFIKLFHSNWKITLVGQQKKSNTS